MKIVNKKNIYLLLLFIISLASAVIVPTYAKFGSNYVTEEDVVGMLLDFDVSISNIEEYEEIKVGAGEYEIFNVQITNNSGNGIYYGIWYNMADVDSDIESVSIGRLDSSDVSTSGFIESKDYTMVTIIVANNSTEDVVVDIGVNSSVTNVSDIEYLEGKRLITDVLDGPVAYAVYSEEDMSLSFYKTFDVIEVGEEYNDKIVTEVYTGIETDTYLVDLDGGEVTVPWYSYAEDITSVEVVDVILPISTIGWFNDFVNCSSFNLEKLVTSKVTDMSYMFMNAGKDSVTFEIDLSHFDTSKVVNMANMFNSVGYNAITWSIGDISNWNVSNVTNMESMFSFSGQNATVWDVGGLNNWNISNVTNVEGMFDNAGASATIWNIGDISNWDTFSLTSMKNMFNGAGKSADVWDIGDLSNWNTFNVMDMSNMFNNAGKNASVWNIGDISNWNTSNVMNMTSMFNNAGIGADYYLNLSAWIVDYVTEYSDFNLGVESKILAPIWTLNIQ